MWHLRITAALAVVLLALPVQAAEITGQYVEVRNCDVWTGPCFANAEGNLVGNNAALVWRITTGSQNGITLDNLSVVAVIQATETLGNKQVGPGKAIIIVDSKATEAQRAELVKLVHQEAGSLVEKVISVRASAISVEIGKCTGGGCAEVDAGDVKIKTRCLDHHDTICGNETAFYPPLISGVDCAAAVAEHSFAGSGLAVRWHETERRGAYVGTFTIR